MLGLGFWIRPSELEKDPKLLKDIIYFFIRFFLQRNGTFFFKEKKILITLSEETLASFAKQTLLHWVYKTNFIKAGPVPGITYFALKDPGFVRL